MDKRGNSFLVLGFLFVLFLLFLFIKSGNLKSISGYAVGDFGNGTNLSVLGITFDKLNVINGTTFSIISDQDFYRYDNIGCIVDYNATGNNYANLTIGFYSQDRSTSNPNQVFYDVLNDTTNNTLCRSDSGFTCLAYYNITDYRTGNWRCFASWDNLTNLSNYMEMKNRPPIFLQNISTISLNVNGTYINGSALNLSSYFTDPEGDSLTYGAVGYFHLNVSVSSDGIVTFSNPNSWEGSEHILFRAYDGSVGTFTNNVTVHIGSGVTSQPAPPCNSVWDCSWGECANGQQTCVYFNRNNCGNNTGKPANLVRSCVASIAGNATLPSQTSASIDLKSLQLQEAKIPRFVGLKRTLIIVGIVVLVVLVLGIGFYVLVSPKKKTDLVQEEQKKNIQQTGNLQQGLQTQAVNLGALQKYIEAALQQGQPEQKIQEDLLKVGWQKKDIDSSFNFIKIKKFVSEKLAAGFEKDKIIESLKAKGWKSETISSIFNELAS